MTEKKILIISPFQIKKFLDLVQHKGWQWSFMGTDSCLREKIIAVLGSKGRYCYAEEFQQVCQQQKQPFLDWVAEIGKSQSKGWWATDMAYKSPLTTDLFLNFCFLHLVKKWLKNKASNKIIIVENPWLRRACLSFDSSCWAGWFIENLYFLMFWFKYQCLSYGRISFFLFRALRMYLLNKVYAFNYRKQVKALLSKNYDVLLCTWLEKRSFKGTESKLDDPYLGTLYDYCKNKGLNFITTTLPIFSYSLLKKTYESNQIIPSIHFSKITDILRACGAALFFRLDKRGIRGDLIYLLNFEELITRAGICYAFFHYLTFANMFKERELFCNSLVYPFENQPWDKMMALAKHELKPDCKLVGCHNIGVPYFYLNFYLGREEGAILPQPDIIVANGRYWQKVLSEAGFSCSVRNGGSLRFQTPATSTNSESHIAFKEKSELDQNVLVLLSASLNYSLDLLFYLLRTCSSQKKYFIKTHPDIPEKVIRKYVKKVPAHFIFVEGAMDEWMTKVGWAIHVGTTAAIECMMKGIKVIKYLPERIDLDPLLGVDLDQPQISDAENIPFEHEYITDAPSASLIAEQFHEITWDEILLKGASKPKYFYQNKSMGY